MIAANPVHANNPNKEQAQHYLFYQSLQELEFTNGRQIEHNTPQIQDSSADQEQAESAEQAPEQDAAIQNTRYSDGYNAGYQDAVTASKTNTDALKSISAKIITSVAHHDRAIGNLQDEFAARVGETVHDAIAQIIPLLRESCGLELVINFLKESSPKIKSNVVVEVNPELAEELRIWLCQSDTVSYSANSHPSDSMNIISVVENDSLDLGDARVLFNECGVEQILATYENSIKNFVKQKLCKGCVSA